MATLTVTNLNNFGVSSLRQAILNANAVPTPDEIAFNLSGGTINLSSARISDDLTINGLGADLLTIDAGGVGGNVFDVIDDDVSNLIEVVITGLTITGRSVVDGGGILNTETLTVTNSTISGNTAQGGSAVGGGIYSMGVKVQELVVQPHANQVFLHLLNGGEPFGASR